MKMVAKCNRNNRKNSGDRTMHIFTPKPVRTVKDDMNDLWRTIGLMTREIVKLHSEVLQLKQKMK